MKLVVFGLTLSSSWGNGHATTYRALLRAFAKRGHTVTFYEWDAPWYGGAHRDLARPGFCELVLYSSWEKIARRATAECLEADAVLIGSYVNHGAQLIDDLAAAGVGPLFFYDIDTPVTVANLRDGSAEYLRADQVPVFARYLSFTGGPFLTDVVEGEFGAQEACPLYCSVDASQYQPARVDPELAVDLAYMGTYAPDRQPVVESFLNQVARRLPTRTFLIAGPQYPAEIDWSPNVRLVPHLPPGRHPAFYSSARWQLNATRADMGAAGWSPSVRLFEAGAIGAPIVSDSWAGIEVLFEPGKELLLPRETEDVVEILTGVGDEERREIGQAMRRRVLAEHTSGHRAEELEQYLTKCESAKVQKCESAKVGE
ncbi:MAG: glycosyltransferase [Gemmatimonadetes bacterium]|nr:glycosyltransferase [Gemmatimonadota bacterium]